ncbi:hypothetical protein GWI33_015235 [Rhynchophorus ferrugineus]|uniref:Uncharacterized protein n=1 Tax=Rhynchophorus ferrugineus TaxID=354439 RepID=A0A834HZS0_RHYFE|nr:hypothetical protein GWI33_015235 [Rhynchophorus ferrugineus]
MAGEQIKPVVERQYAHPNHIGAASIGGGRTEGAYSFISFTQVIPIRRRNHFSYAEPTEGHYGNTAPSETIEISYRY